MNIEKLSELKIIFQRIKTSLDKRSQLIEESKVFSLMLFGLCLIWLISWGLLPIIFVDGTLSDQIENIVCGKHIFWSYDKNPYFGAWLTRFGYFITCKSLWFTYIFCSISIAVCLTCVWKLARCFLSPARSFISVIFLLNIFYNGSLAVQFNDNAIAISLWALTILFFYKSLLNQKHINWFFLGLFSGLNFMTKYYCVALFLPMAIVLLTTKEGRNSFRQAGLYICIATFIVLITPNIIWLTYNNFVTILYAFHSASPTKHFFGLSSHITEPLMALVEVFKYLWSSILLFFICFFKRNYINGSITGFNHTFVSILCFGPLALTLIFSILMGAVIKGPWLFPIFSLTGIYMVMLWRPDISIHNLKLYILLIFLSLLVFIIGFSSYFLYIQPYLKEKTERASIPNSLIAEDITNLWHQKYGTKIKYVIGGREMANRFAVFSADLPEVFLTDNPSYNQYWIDKSDLYKCGAVAIWEGNLKNTPQWLKTFNNSSLTIYPTKTYCRALKPWFKTLIKREPKTLEVTFAFIKPQQ